MSRVLFSCAALGMVIAASASVSPAAAAPYHLIRWHDTGYCEIWDMGFSIQPVRWLTTYDVVSKRRPTLDASLATKDRLLKRGVCRF